MRVAALYDIHGNLPALEAVLADVERESVDLIVVGGDVYPGPMCEEALSFLLRLDTPVRFIMGNGDRETLALAAGEEVTGAPASYLPAMRWVAERLSLEHRREMSGWPKTIEVEIGGVGSVLFCHGTPESDTAIFTRRTAEDELLETFGAVSAGLFVCGHTHMQFDRMVGGTRVVNAGSVGMPFGEPGAYWLLVDRDAVLRRTAYDFEAAAERVRGTGYPQRESTADAIVQPPSEEAMLDVFTCTKPQ